MNGFIVHLDPITAARSLVDLHTNKMIVESGQCLSTGIHLNGVNADDIYKISYPKHPTILSIKKNRKFAMWMLEHALELCIMYTEHTGKVHKTEPILFNCAHYIGAIPDERELTDIRPACGIYNTYSKDIVEVYRKFYVNDKAAMAKWTKRNTRPSWFSADLFDYAEAWYLQEKRNARLRKPMTEDLFRIACKNANLM